MSDRRNFQRVALLAAALIAGASGVLGSTDPRWMARESPRFSLIDSVDEFTDDQEITGRDIDLIDRNLDLDDSQRELVDALFAGYGRQFKDRSTAHDAKVSSLYEQAREAPQATDRRSIHAQIRTARDDWDLARARLNGDFLESVKEVLTQGQLDHWHRVERDRRRRIMLTGPSRFAAENIDLIDLVEDLNFAAGPRDAIDPTLNSWADELDSLLQSRKTAQAQWSAEGGGRFDTGDPTDPARRQELRDRLDQRCRAIRDLNLRSSELMISQLASPASDRFRSTFDLAAYPIIYRPTPADHYIDRVLALPDLTGEHIEAITSINLEYGGQVLALNDQLAVLMRRQEDADPDTEEMKRIAFERPGGVSFDGKGNALIGNLQGVVSMTVTTDPLPGQPGVPRVIVPGLDRADPASPQGQLEASKRELIQHTIDAVFALLTPEQQAAAPRPTAQQMLTPEEKMRRVMEEAFRTAKVTRNADGSVTFELHIEEDESPEK